MPLLYELHLMLHCNKLAAKLRVVKKQSEGNDLSALEAIRHLGVLPHYPPILHILSYYILFDIDRSLCTLCFLERESY